MVWGPVTRRHFTRPSVSIRLRIQVQHVHAGNCMERGGITVRAHRSVSAIALATAQRVGRPGGGQGSQLAQRGAGRPR